jgi:hypothetical protein
VFAFAGGELSLTVHCVTTSNDVQIALALDGKDARSPETVGPLYKIASDFVPPLGTLSPSEQELSWPLLKQELARGKYAETWRNQLHWLNEGQQPEGFQSVVKGVREYIGDVKINPPRRTREHPPQIVVTYSEDGADYDISAGGGGMRTMVSLAASLELSTASILLFDEPDAHLHSTVQRQVAQLLAARASTGRQVLIATHAPDFIDEVPVESLLWVERRKSQAERCDEAGKTLIRLGAVSNSQAMRTLGSDVVLFFEASPDRHVLLSLMKRCGKATLVDRVKTAKLKGFGDASLLPSALRILKTLIPMKVAVAAILDADYTRTQPELTEEDLGEVLIFRLPCKELENLLLLSPDTIYAAARKAAEMREANSGSPAVAPSREEVESKIEELSAATDLREIVETQWLVRWAEPQGGIHDPGQLTKGKREFEKHWSSLEWRRRCCPGKEVLRRMRQWLQSEPYKLSLTLPRLFDAYQPDADIQRMFDNLEQYVKRAV